MRYVISYDLAENKPRNKLAKLLEGYGVRVQYSVFECNLTEKKFKKLYAQILALTEKEEGSVRFYPLCRSCEGRIVTIGKPISVLAAIETEVIVV